MRKVAGYKLVNQSSSVDTTNTIYEKTLSLVEEWLLSKNASILPETEKGPIYVDNSIHYDKKQFDCNMGSIVDYRVYEISLNTNFKTQIAIGAINFNVYVYLAMSVKPTQTVIEPSSLDVKCPQLIRDIIYSESDWMIGNIPAMTTTLAVNNNNASKFIELLWHDQRSIPIVAISTMKHPSIPINNTFYQKVALDLSGLAIVAELDEDASYYIVDNLGGRWSCFFGAIRIYWPTKSNQDHYMHPFWKIERIINKQQTINEALQSFRRMLRNKILGLSAYYAWEPEEFREIRSIIRKREQQELFSRINDDKDWEQLAIDYCERVEKLENDIDQKDNEIVDLQTQLANLKSTYSWKSIQVASQDDIEPEAQIESIEDVLEKARENFHDVLVFGEDVDGGMSNLAPNACPPEKIYRYLECLHEMGCVLKRKPSLNNSIIGWLNENGVNASTESETILNSDEEMSKRIWHDGERRSQFKFHLKPTDAAHPDKCVRIYFKYDKDHEFIRIGWIGRHP